MDHVVRNSQWTRPDAAAAAAERAIQVSDNSINNYYTTVLSTQ